MTGCSLSNFTVLEFHVELFHIGFKKCFSLGIYLSLNSMHKVENVKINLGKYQIHKVTSRKIPKASPRIYIFSKGIFSGLLFCAVSVQTFEFSNAMIEKRISRRVRSYYSYTRCAYCTS